MSPRGGKVSFNYNGRQELVTLIEIPFFPIFYFFITPAGPRKKPNQSPQLLFTQSHSRAFSTARVGNKERAFSATWLVGRRVTGLFRLRCTVCRRELRLDGAVTGHVSR